VYLFYYRKEFQAIYDRLGIKNLQERGESFYHELMPLAIEDLEKEGELYYVVFQSVFFIPLIT